MTTPGNTATFSLQNDYTEKARQLAQATHEIPTYAWTLWKTGCHFLTSHKEPGAARHVFKLIPKKWLQRCTNHNGANFALIAARWGDRKLIELAFEKGVSPDATDALSSAHTFFNYFMANRSWPEADFPTDEQTIAFTHEIFEKVCGQGVHLDYKDSLGRNLAQQAISASDSPDIMHEAFHGWLHSKRPDIHQSVSHDLVHECISMTSQERTWQWLYVLRDTLDIHQKNAQGEYTLNILLESDKLWRDESKLTHFVGTLAKTHGAGPAWTHQDKFGMNPLARIQAGLAEPEKFAASLAYIREATLNSLVPKFPGPAQKQKI